MSHPASRSFKLPVLRKPQQKAANTKAPVPPLAEPVSISQPCNSTNTSCNDLNVRSLTASHAVPATLVPSSANAATPAGMPRTIFHQSQVQQDQQKASTATSSDGVTSPPPQQHSFMALAQATAADSSLLQLPALKRRRLAPAAAAAASKPTPQCNRLLGKSVTLKSSAISSGDARTPTTACSTVSCPAEGLTVDVQSNGAQAPTLSSSLVPAIATRLAVRAKRRSSVNQQAADAAPSTMALSAAVATASATSGLDTAVESQPMAEPLPPKQPASTISPAAVGQVSATSTKTAPHSNTCEAEELVMAMAKEAPDLSAASFILEISQHLQHMASCEAVDRGVLADDNGKLSAVPHDSDNQHVGDQLPAEKQAPAQAATTLACILLANGTSLPVENNKLAEGNNSSSQVQLSAAAVAEGSILAAPAPPTTGASMIAAAREAFTAQANSPLPKGTALPTAAEQDHATEKQHAIPACTLAMTTALPFATFLVPHSGSAPAAPAELGDSKDGSSPGPGSVMAASAYCTEGNTATSDAQSSMLPLLCNSILHHHASRLAISPHAMAIKSPQLPAAADVQCIRTMKSPLQREVEEEAMSQQRLDPEQHLGQQQQREDSDAGQDHQAELGLLQQQQQQQLVSGQVGQHDTPEAVAVADTEGARQRAASSNASVATAGLITESAECNRAAIAVEAAAQSSDGVLPHAIGNEQIARLRLLPPSDLASGWNAGFSRTLPTFADTTSKLPQLQPLATVPDSIDQLLPQQQSLMPAQLQLWHEMMPRKLPPPSAQQPLQEAGNFSSNGELCSLAAAGSLQSEGLQHVLLQLLLASAAELPCVGLYNEAAGLSGSQAGNCDCNKQQQNVGQQNESGCCGINGAVSEELIGTEAFYQAHVIQQQQQQRQTTTSEGEETLDCPKTGKAAAYSGGVRSVEAGTPLIAEAAKSGCCPTSSGFVEEAIATSICAFSGSSKISQQSQHPSAQLICMQGAVKQEALPGVRTDNTAAIAVQGMDIPLAPAIANFDDCEALWTDLAMLLD